MEMCCNGALVMPQNYAIIDESEMTYVEGGYYVKTYWWGNYQYFSHSERQTLVTVLAGASLATTCANLGIVAATLGTLATILWNYDEGYGIKLRYTVGIGYTGVYSLTKGEYEANM